MCRTLLSSDLHLGHESICRFRTQFSTPDEHHNTVYENLASAVGKRDKLILLGDVAFTHEWLLKIRDIRCASKVLVMGNHDSDRKIKAIDLVGAFDEIHSLFSFRNVLLSHCPIHPSQFRGKVANIHGHMHEDIIEDSRYLNVCVEHTNYKPITFAECMERLRSD